MRLEQALDGVAQRRPDHLALQLASGQRFTYAELVDRSKQLAGVLGDLGVNRGARVAIVSRHDLEAIALFFAVLRCGAIVVWLNDDTRAADTAAVIERAEPVLAVIQQDKFRTLFNTATETSVLTIAELCARPALPNDKVMDMADTDPAVLVFTSGSSGTPKGVCLSHRNIFSVDHAVIEHMPITENDAYMMVVPLHYVHGLMQLTVHLLAGASIHFFDNFLFPKKVVEAIRNTRVSGFSGVPFHFNALISRGGLLDSDLPDLRWVTVTGGKLAADTILQVIDHFPELQFHIAYGQTECAPRATALHPDKVRSKPDSVGSAIPGVTVLLLDDSGQHVSDGEVGEVVIAGDNIMLGYWRDDAATANAIDAQGRLHTGDLGRFDQDGDLFLVGRKSAMIKSAGERIVPEEIERVLTGFDGVTDAVVVGVDDTLLGQRVVAHVQMPDIITTHDEIIKSLRQHLSTQVAMARLPREYHVWEEFPRKTNGKPDRVLLTQAKADN